MTETLFRESYIPFRVGDPWWVNGDRHFANAQKHLADGNREYAIGSMRKAERNWRRAICIERSLAQRRTVKMQHDFILLDRSGSMSGQWGEAVSSVNAYVKELADKDVDTGVTLAVFDQHGGLDFRVIRDRIIPKTWSPVSEAEIVPRGGTPLSDAVGRLVALARTGNYDKVAIIVMTDGEENASTELSVPQAKALLDECRAKGWQVIFLGAGFSNKAQSASFGTMSAQSVASIPKAGLANAMRGTASMRANYGATGQAMAYSDEEKARLQRGGN